MRQMNVRTGRDLSQFSDAVTAIGAGAYPRPDRSDLPVVFVVDGDGKLRDSLAVTIRTEEWKLRTFASAEEFLSRPPTFGPGCLVLATAPQLGGLEVQARVAAERPDLPIIFVADHGDVATTVKAMKAGATEVLARPLNEEDLITALRQSLALSAAMSDQEAEVRSLRQRYADLSPREREVMALVLSGRLNKQVGGELGISEITVKAHRGKVMRKMQAKSLVHLVHMAMRLGLRVPSVAA